MPRTDLIKDRDTITDHVAKWMHDHFRDASIDKLLTWPDKATAMAKYVCKKLQRKATSEAIHEVLRAALAARKAGDLKKDAY